MLFAKWDYGRSQHVKPMWLKLSCIININTGLVYVFIKLRSMSLTCVVNQYFEQRKIWSEITDDCSFKALLATNVCVWFKADAKLWSLLQQCSTFRAHYMQGDQSRSSIMFKPNFHPSEIFDWICFKVKCVRKCV